MVKSFAQETQGGWLDKQLQSALRNTAHDFNGASDPLYARRMEDRQKSEAQRRSVQIGGNGVKKRSKPEPALKPESQRGRVAYAAPSPQEVSATTLTPLQPVQTPPSSSQQESNMSHIQNNAWLSAHYWHALNKAKPATSQSKPDNQIERKIKKAPQSLRLNHNRSTAMERNFYDRYN